MGFSPTSDFYAAAAQVIPLLLLALIFEARVLTRLRAVLPRPADARINALLEEADQVAQSLRIDDDYQTAIRRTLHGEIRDQMVRDAGLGPHRWVVVVVLLAIAAALGAEAVALVALVLTDPPDALAGIVLAGCGILVVALLASIGDVVVREMRRTPPAKH